MSLRPEEYKSLSSQEDFNCAVVLLFAIINVVSISQPFIDLCFLSVLVEGGVWGGGRPFVEKV